MEQFFKIAERNSTPGQELIGGLTTFLAMVYIAAVNPIIMQDAGMSFPAALTATCIGAGICTIAMGLIANRPVALASGMGLNAFVAYTICLGCGVDWRVAMACVFVEGIVIFIIVLLGLREAIMYAIPKELRQAIAVGIGLFIALIGLKGSGIVVADASTLIAMGAITDPNVIVGFVSILAVVILYTLKVKGSILLSIVIATIVGIPLGVTQIPTTWFSGFDFSAFAAPFQEVPGTGTLGIVEVFMKPALLIMTFSLLMTDFFDTMGGLLGIGRQAGFCDEEGNIEGIRPIFLVDSASAALGGFLGASSITVYSESLTGIAAGARTGLCNVATGVLFLICPLFAPAFGMVTSSATCGALVMVGYLMMADINLIDWRNIALAFPAFLTIITIPLTYSISNGIGVGFISYVIIMVITGKAKQVHALMWISSLAFLIYFIMG